MEATHRRNADAVLTPLVDTVADAVDADPLALEPPLHHAVDVDALVRLLDSDGLDRVQFEYAGHTVRVDGDGTITVDGR